MEHQPIRGPRGLMVERSTRHNIPLTAIVELTHRCNEQCIHCYVVQPIGKSKNELSTAEWKKALQQLAAEGTMEITFSGGEPLLRDDLFDILREARRLNFAIKLSTNATLVGRREAEELGRLKLWEVGVSLYAAEETVHDAITKVAGSFRKTVRGVRFMIEQGLRVKIRSVLMRQNFGNEATLKALADELGASFAQDPLMTPVSNGSHDNLVHRLSRGQLRQSLIPDLDKFSQDFDPERWEAIKLDKLHSNMCKAGINFCCISTEGKVLPCVQFQLVAGDLREQSFHDVWRSSPVFLKLRKTFNRDLSTCGDCRLLPICFRCPGEALLSDGHAFGPSSWACMRSELIEELYREKRARAQEL